jgi:hypothetical protein
MIMGWGNGAGTPWTVVPERAGEARPADRAVEAVALGEFQVRRGLGEPELWVLHSARQFDSRALGLERVEVQQRDST